MASLAPVLRHLTVPLAVLTASALTVPAQSPPPAAGPSASRPGAAQAETPDRALELRALEALEKGLFVRARESAARLLARDPDNALAHFVFGSAIHHGDGNIPLALRHLRRARELAARPGDSDLHRRTLLAEMRALSDLGRYEELLDLSARFRQLYDPQYLAVDVWPLMKLGRIDQARAAAARALATGDEYEEVIARNGLCAMDGYEACRQTVDVARREGLPAGVALRNLAVAAAVDGRFDEAESLLIEATRRPDPDVNPWRDLTDLFAAEGRLAEAAQAASKMIAFGRRMPPRARQYSRAEERTAVGHVLLLAGEPERALAATREALRAPDRTAHWSGAAAGINSEAALLHRAVLLDLAERERERAALGSVLGSLRAAPRRASLTLAAWRAGRRLLPLLLAGGLRPHDTARDQLRPELAASSWLFLDGVELAGAGPVLGIVRGLLAEPPPVDGVLPPALREGLIRALECEAQWHRGARVEALAAGRRARELLPDAEVLLRTRLAARMADAAQILGRHAEAAALYDEVLDTDPGILRRLRIALPLRRESFADRRLAGAARKLFASPRFRSDDDAPYRLAAAPGTLCVTGLGGAVVGCGAAAEENAAPDSLAGAVIDAVFSPRIDLSQGVLDSLDGSPGAGRRLSEGDLPLR